MAFRRKSYREIADDILAQLARGEVREKYDYALTRTGYKLYRTPVRDILRVEGVSDGVTTVFEKGIDYRLNADALEWLAGGKHPNDKTPFYATYAFGASDPSRRITDVNPGSVVRNLVESISREMDYLYAQLEAVYSAGFIDTATGSALDLVVSILGVARKPPQNATGPVIFGRSTDPPELPAKTDVLLFDGRMDYALKSSPIKSIKRVDGSFEGESPHKFVSDKDYKLEDGKIFWLPDGKRPDLNSEFRVEYSAFEKIVIPEGSRVSTFSREPSNIRTFVTTEERELQKTREGKWEADVPVKSVAPGRFGNVPPGAVTLMPQPPIGVEYVINRRDIGNGVEAESDEDLRERAKRALEKVGKATLLSLESAIQGVEGVRSVLVEDMPEGVRGLVRVVVQGGNQEQVERVIEETRAAGVKVELLRPDVVYVDMNIVVALDRGVLPSQVKRRVEEDVGGYLSSLEIGQDVLYNRIINVVLSIEGVHDVKEMQVTANRKDGEVRVSTRENISMSENELAELRTVTVITEEES